MTNTLSLSLNYDLPGDNLIMFRYFCKAKFGFGSLLITLSLSGNRDIGLKGGGGGGGGSPLEGGRDGWVVGHGHVPLLFFHLSI